ncbi:HET-domain-containing protein [Lepidopterella palustris CBS 459.81]|uniref:HET-domain-containing protein n=1 Tax=Lepidopterella palustris CBS 459.81 TaxID=1314670 RepID=A0A8E2EKK5_9PEZI|nr:HET-domain-containing protein [Lepidopterella palustris CBS 459.81]
MENALTTPSNQHFEYTTLSSSRSIRLVKLNDRSKSRNGSVSFSLLTTHFDNAPVYLALSYTWGDPACPFLDLLTPLPALPVETLCDGQPFYVGPNLSVALERLEYLIQDKPDMYIWIDAICINQADDAERASQVKMMGEIYTRAQKVYAWLGPKDASSNEALYILEQISRPSFETVKRAAGSVDFQFPETYAQKLGILPIPVGSWFAWGALMERSYFNRVWILQEVVNAAEVTFLIGDSQFGMLELEKAVLYLNELHWIQFLRPGPLSMAMKSSHELRHQIPKKYENLIASTIANGGRSDMMTQLAITRIRHKIWNVEDPELISFKALLKSHRERRASDPRDKIFALLSLATASVYPYASKSELEAIVDYDVPRGRNLEWASARLYTQLAWKFIRTDRSLKFLNEKEDEASTKLDDLPSWAPDWSTGALHNSPLPEFSTRPWKATGRLVAHIERMENLLHVRGLRLGSVVQSSALPDQISVNSTARFQSFIPMISALPLVTSQGLSRLQLFSATCMLDEYQGKIPASEDVAYIFLAFILRHLSRVWHERETAASDGSLDFEIPPEKEVPSRRRAFKLFSRNNASLPPDFSNPLTAPWLDLIQAERSVSGIKLSTLEQYLKGASYKTRIAPWLDIGSIFNRFIAALANKRLVRTDTMMLGIARRSVRSGDEVWILAGGHTPYILRKRGNDRYLLLCEAYVQGVMFGEVADEAKLVGLVLE